MTRGDGTRAVRAGLPPPAQGEPFLPGPTFAAPYHLAGDPASTPYGYARFANPTWEAYERAIGGLEGGHAVAFASGMAAIAAVLLPLLSAGDVLVATGDGYPTLRALASEHLAPRGVEVRYFSHPEEPPLDGATVVWVETPANPVLAAYDIRAIAAEAHARGALLAVDNTVPTPLGQLPLELGADLSVTSGSKALTGHSDLLMGLVAARDGELLGRVKTWRDRTGGVPGPFEAWLAHRSLATLELRLERQCATALALAEMLAGRDDVAVRYPGLASDPAHEVARRQMTRFGPLVAIDLGSQERAEAFLSGCRLVVEATSFGGLHTTAERRARWGQGDAVGPGFIRFSCGCEDTADVLDDVRGALDSA